MDIGTTPAADPAHQATIGALDCDAIMREAGLADGAAAGVLWRGPDDAKFTFYMREQWLTMAPLLVNDGAQRSVADMLDVAAANRGSHVFCWAFQSQWAGLPLIGRLFFAPVYVWHGRLTADEKPLAELRRSARPRRQVHYAT